MEGGVLFASHVLPVQLGKETLDRGQQTTVNRAD